MAVVYRVSVPGALLAAEWSPAPHDEPAGAPLVFLHAGVADGRMWQPQWQAFAATHPLLRYDRRGFGASRVDAAAPYSRVADLWAVLDAAGLSSAVLVGCSQGGRLAIDAALAQPQRVQALVLVAPSVGGAPGVEPTGPTAALVTAIEAAKAAGALAELNELQARLWLDGPAGPPGRVGGAARALFLAMNDIALRAADPGPVTDADTAWPRLETLHMPTLVVCGDRDLPHLLDRCAVLARRIPAARQVVLAGVAHLPGLEAPAPFNAALADFLRGLPGAAAAH